MNGTKGAAYLFDGWQETMIWSCLQEHMGSERQMAVCRLHRRESAWAISVFCRDARRKPDSRRQHTHTGSKNRKLGTCNRKVLGAEAIKAQRYAIKKEPEAFDCEILEKYAASLPAAYELRPIDQELYEQIMTKPWAKDLCSQFRDGDDYVRRGLGFAAVLRGDVVAGASSYTIYDDGIEIEIDTNKEFRNRGFASACGSRLILSA